MLRGAGELTGYSIAATDGEIGEVGQFYFDDEKWTIRYLIAETGGWLMGRKVLISPPAFDQVDWEGRRLKVKLTKAQVENSPDIDTDKPVSRQHEMDYYDYYGYPYYWTGPYLWGPVVYPAGYPAASPVNAPNTLDKELAGAAEQQDDAHLRSTKEVTNYHIGAKDGDIGHVEDFLVDDQNWMIRYIVVDTRNWWPGKKVLVSPEWIERVSWPDSKVYVDLTQQAIKNAPEYDPSGPIRRDYEERLHEHYGRTRYWSG